MVRRIGTERARGQIAVWTDADMTYPNEQIPEFVQLLEKDETIDQVADAYRYILQVPRMMSRLLGLARQPPLEHPLSGRTLAVALGWSFAVQICNGVQIWLLTIRLGAPIGSSLLLAIGGYAFAWSVGFIVVFAPAGVGPREVMLVTTLSPVLGPGGATAVALVSRALRTTPDGCKTTRLGAPAARRLPPTSSRALPTWTFRADAGLRDYTPASSVCTLPPRVLNMALALSL